MMSDSFRRCCLPALGAAFLGLMFFTGPVYSQDAGPMTSGNTISAPAEPTPDFDDRQQRRLEREQRRAMKEERRRAKELEREGRQGDRREPGGRGRHGERDDPEERRGMREGKGRGRTPSMPYPTAGWPHAVVLGQPTLSRITVSVLPTRDMQAAIEYGKPGSAKPQRTAMQTLSSGSPAFFQLEHLEADTTYE